VHHGFQSAFIIDFQQRIACLLRLLTSLLVVRVVGVERDGLNAQITTGFLPIFLTAVSSPRVSCCTTNA
jgi:hypothetical protein